MGEWNVHGNTHCKTNKVGPILIGNQIKNFCKLQHREQDKMGYIDKQDMPTEEA